jgi:hypothetical protein
MSDASELLPIAKRVVWYQPPEETLADTQLFLAHLMTYGTLDEVRAVRRQLGDREFEAVLDDPPSGIFDERSWAYWNLHYHRDPVPQLPTRKIPGV